MMLLIRKSQMTQETWKMQITILPRTSRLHIALLAIAAAASLTPAPVFAKDLNMCIDPRFAKQGELKIFMHMMVVAAQNAGHTLNLTPMNWEECQETVRGGKYDGAVPASFNADRSEYMVYPQDAGKNPDSKWSLARINYVVVTPTGTNYQYTGDPKTIPQPVMLPEGYSIVSDLAKIAPSLQIKEMGSDDKTNLVRLLRGEKGSVVMMDRYADVLLERTMFKNKLKATSRGVVSKTYFMPFSRTSGLTNEQIQKIWDQISLIKNDAKWMKTQMDALD